MGVKGLAALLIMLVSVAATGAVHLVFPEEEEVVPREGVMVANLQGAIEEGGGMFMAAAISPQRVREVLQQAEEDASVGAVVLRIDSPGGSVAASQQISSLIRDFEKPVVISMADMVVSGGYYISAPADGIVAHPGTITGSIGVISTFVDLEGFLENLGLETDVIKSGEHKDMFSRSLTEEERELMQELSDEAYNQFVEDVARGRDLEISRVEEFATGEMILGSKAERIGLVDRLGGEEEAVEMAGELAGIEDPAVKRYGEMGFWDMLISPGFQASSLLEHVVLPEEVILMDKAKRGGEPRLRYEVR